MSKDGSRSGPAVADGRDAQLKEFLATLANAGYAEKTQRDKERLIVPLIRWAREARIGMAALDEACIGAFLACPWRRRYGHRTALHQFLQYLRIVGVVPPRPLETSPADDLVQRYLDHLRDHQGLCLRTIEVYAAFVHAFVVAQQLPERFVDLGASAIRSYLLDRSQSRSASFVRLLTAALRSFLRFCFFKGTSPVDLSTAVPPVRRWRLASVPPSLAAEEVERVIEAIDCSTPRGCRALAILLLLARLGLRAGEVVALEIDDIGWDVGEIMVRGKGRLHDRLPLLKDVGEALARYLGQARGQSASRRVFLRHYAPRVGLSGPHAVSAIARDALRRAGLEPAGRVGAHVFRHSLATRMIQRGASLAEISQVLRHRGVETTQLYAKVDFEALRGVALPWPSAEAHQ